MSTAIRKVQSFGILWSMLIVKIFGQEICDKQEVKKTLVQYLIVPTEIYTSQVILAIEQPFS